MNLSLNPFFFFLKMQCDVDPNGDEIFIVDEEIVREFFKDENFEGAQMFFDYLTIHCKTKKSYMIPSILEKIKNRIKEKTYDETLQTEVISYLENWIEEAELLGEDLGEEIHDTLLLYKLLKVLNPGKKVIILSSKYKEIDVESLEVDYVQSYLLSKKEFKQYLKDQYGFNDDSSY